MIVCLDPRYRPAAIEQLRLLGRKTGVDVFDLGTDATPVEIATRGLEKARAEGFDTIIVDTAGRLQVRSPPDLPPGTHLPHAVRRRHDAECRHDVLCTVMIFKVLPCAHCGTST